MHTFVLCVHIGVGLFMILTVLLQSGKAGGGIGFGGGAGGGGGGSNTVFGASGAGNFLTKLTTTCAVVFMVTSLTLTYMAGFEASDSVVKDVPEPVGAESTDTPAMQKGTDKAKPEAK